MAGGNKSKRYSNASAISDRSGRRFPMREMVNEPGTNFLVHWSESDGEYSLVKHPLNNQGKYLAGRLDDPKPLRNARPDRDWSEGISWQGSCNINGVASVLSTPTKISYGSSNLVGSATLNATGDVFFLVEFKGTGTVTAEATKASLAGEVLILGSADLESTASIHRSATVSLIGTSVLSVEENKVSSGSATLVGEAYMSGEGASLKSGSATLTGTASVLASVDAIYEATVELTGTSIMEATGLKQVLGTANISGTAIITSTALKVVFGSANITGKATTSATGTKRSSGTATLTGEATVTSEATVDSGVNFMVNGELITKPGWDTRRIPSGVTYIFVDMWGAGGGGGQSWEASMGGAGGGAGGYAQVGIEVTPETDFGFYVGEGGSGYYSDNGEPTYLDDYYYSADGGGGGYEGSPGSGGDGYGDNTARGEDGEEPDFDTYFTGKGGKAPNSVDGPFVEGGEGGARQLYTNTQGFDGVAPGGGGGGAISEDFEEWTAGKGGNGGIRFWW